MQSVCLRFGAGFPVRVPQSFPDCGWSLGLRRELGHPARSRVPSVASRSGPLAHAEPT